MRTVESAVALRLKGLSWQFDERISERCWGDYDSLGPVLLDERHPDAYAERLRAPFNWKPLNGESFAEIIPGRITEFNEDIVRCGARCALIVTHSDLTYGFKFLFERMTVDQFNAMYDDPVNAVTYGQIRHYTRINPLSRRLELPGVIWMRAIDPMKPCDPKIPWRRIELFVTEEPQAEILSL